MASSVTKVLFLVPPVRLHHEEFEYLLHWPRHAIVLAAELGPGYEAEIVDISAEFLSDSEALSIRAVATPVIGSSTVESPLAPILERLIRDRVQEFCPDIVVVHAHAAPHLPIVKLTLEALESQLAAGRSTQIVVGGMAATHLADVISEWVPDGTWIVRGEGTGRCRDLFELILGRRPVNPLDEIVTERQSRRVSVVSTIDTGSLQGQEISRQYHQNQMATVRVLDIQRNPPVMDYPLPRFDLLPMDLYQELFRRGEFVPHLELSSGCTFRCKFCGVHYLGAEGRFRRRPPHLVIEELACLRKKYGFDEFYFCDETFTLDRKHARELCEQMIEQIPGIRWRCVTRVDQIDDELARLMHRAGCYEIGFGVEVGNEDVLAANTKDATVSLNCQVIRRVQENGIEANALTIIGMPQEDHSDLRRTFEFLARDARPKKCQIFVFHPVPGTEYFREPEKFGLHFDTRDVNEWYKWDHVGEPVCETEYLSREDIARYFLLFNRALPTIIDPDPDPELIARILGNRFPVRRKGVTWLLAGTALRIYHPLDRSKRIPENAQDIEISRSDDPVAAERELRAVEFLLSRCNGLLTRSELTAEVAGLFGLSQSAAEIWTDQILHVLLEGNFIAEF